MNLYDFLDDTKDLSTIRGGGLALLEGPAIIETLIKASAPPSATSATISRGASVGLYELELTASDTKDATQQAATWRDKVVSALGQVPVAGGPEAAAHHALRHATLVVDVAPLGGGAPNVNSAIASATAANRWRQLQQGSVQWPEASSAVGGAPCALDGVRPANVMDTAPRGLERMLSRATKDRRDYGRSTRQDVYDHVCSFKTKGRFSNHLEELTKNDANPRLTGKMAVIYADGNDFGSLVSSFTTVEQRRRFDDSLRRKQGEMLATYLGKLETRITTPNDILPIETLLWGGDEAMWIVPAWHARNFLSNLLGHPFLLAMPGTEEVAEELVRLSFGVGVVFCHHNAPIRRIKALAYGLADVAKDRGKRTEAMPNDGAANGGARRHHRSYVAYEVLESFDHLGMPVDTYRKRRQDAEGVAGDQLLLPGDDFDKIIETLAHLTRELSAGVVHGAGKSRARPDEKERAMARGAAALEEFKESNPEVRSDVERLQQVFGSALWTHLIDLRDYLSSEAGEGA